MDVVESSNCAVAVFIKFCLFLSLMILFLLGVGDVELNPGPAIHYLKKNCRVVYSNKRGLLTNTLHLQSRAQNYDIYFIFI